MAKKKSSLPVESLSCSIAKPTATDRARERQYQVEDGLRTMQRAADIVKDKGLLKDIKAFAKQQVSDLNKVAK